MKKFILLLFAGILLTGCSSKEEVIIESSETVEPIESSEDVTEEIEWVTGVWAVDFGDRQINFLATGISPILTSYDMQITNTCNARYGFTVKGINVYIGTEDPSELIDDLLVVEHDGFYYVTIADYNEGIDAVISAITDEVDVVEMKVSPMVVEAFNHYADAEPENLPDDDIVYYAFVQLDNGTAGIIHTKDTGSGIINIPVGLDDYTCTFLSEDTLLIEETGEVIELTFFANPNYVPVSD